MTVQAVHGELPPPPWPPSRELVTRRPPQPLFSGPDRCERAAFIKASVRYVTYVHLAFSNFLPEIFLTSLDCGAL